MSELNELYKCELCGQIVEVVHTGEGELVCCEVPMIKIEAQSEDPDIGEKHVPVIIEENGEKIIKIGSTPHPMEQEHFIVFIEAISPDNQYLKRKFLNPGDSPELAIKCHCEHLTARALCNIHGLWKLIYSQN